MPSKLNELSEIADILTEKLSAIQKSGDLTTYYYLEDTIEKLKNYIREKEKANLAENRK